MEKLKAKLQGKKTHIIAVLGVLAVWADYFFGIGLSDKCANTVEVCTMSLQDAATYTWNGILAMTIRMGIASKIK